MARRRKAAAKPATRRMPRRGKAAAVAADGEASAAAADPPAAAEPAAPETPAELDPPAAPAPDADLQPSVSLDSQAIQIPKPAPVPTVVLHKKFGKYRCLFNNEDSFSKRYDLGSDSETNSSVEIRVVDPCASSESDSNAAADTHADNASAVTNFSSLNDTTNEQSTCSNMSPVVVLNSLPTSSVVPIVNEIPMPCETQLLTELPVNSEIPLPSEPLIAPSEASSCELTVPNEIPLLSEPTFPSGMAVAAGITLPSEIPLPVGAPTTSEAPFPIEASLTSEIPFPAEPSQASIPYTSESVSPGLSMVEAIPLPVGIPLLNDIPMPEGPALFEASENHVPDPHQVHDHQELPVIGPALADVENNRTGLSFDQNYEDSSTVNKDTMNPDIPGDQEPMDYGGDDEELITIVQIVEDDNQELYYNIKMDSPEETKEQYEKKEQDGEFQKHFEKLNIASASTVPMDSQPGSRAQISETQPLKSENLTRPDPSLTPSSIQSDDSNSSRVAEPAINFSNESAESSPTGVRRSSRIKTISSQKQKSKGYGLVKTPLKKALITQTKLKLEENNSDSQEKSGDATANNAPNSPSFPVPSDLPVKVKSRWRRSSELEMGANSPANSPLASPSLPQRLQPVPEAQNHEEDQPTPALSKEAYDKLIDDRMKQFHHLDENEYLCERMISKDTKKMICDCFMTKEEIERGELGCGEDCLNRLLMIECNSRCPVGDRCTNRRFERRENGALRVFYADKKGCGVEAADDIPSGEFLMEYVGEVLDYDQFYKRAQTYSDENNLHHYFMSLKGDTVIDATMKGNISRFINHSCDPNAETQKWTVNGELRIGFFSKRDIAVGEEITFDYQFKRFGKEAQRCYCGADSCRGWIGGEPDSEDDDEEEEEEESTYRSETEESVEAPATAQTPETPRRPRRPRQYKSSAELVQDADIEEDLEALHRTGVKNQSHTLRLSRTVVRAKTRRAQVALLRLLRDADLPCRRLFLDYRGLRLLAPWCTDAPVHFRLEMLQTVDRLPITNKTMVSESRFFTIVERWLSDAPPEVYIDETTGLPIELPNRTLDESPEKSKENAAILEKVKDLSSQLLERWSSLKEAFKIPKKERIQQMKEHERQANVERRAADSSGSRDRDRERRDERDRERERERERERDRDRERERERDRDRDRYRERERDREREREERDRRKRRGSSPDGRRCIRSSRVLASVPPLSKEERRRAFAEAAAAAEDSRRQREQHFAHYWPEHNAFPQMFPPSMLGAPPNMLGPMVPGLGGLVPGMDVPPDWAPPGDFQPPPGFCPPFGPPQQFCMPPANLMGNMGMSGYGMPGFMFGQQMPPNAFPPTPQPAETMMPVPVPEAPPPSEVVLPSMWRSATDARGRTYYYHVKLRQPQWLPPPPPLAADESSSEEETEQVSAVDAPATRRQGKFVEGVNGIYEVIRESNGLIPEHALVNVKPRKRRPGLVSERPISPRTEEDKLAGRQEVKRYRQTKEKLRRRREKLLHKVRELAQRSRKPKAIDQAMKMVDLVDSDSDSEQSVEETEPAPAPAPEPVPAEPEPPASVPSPVDTEAAVRKLKEQFRSSMARVMVHHLNPYRHSDAPAGRITCTADFKHLARKLTHFVMLKELKHCRSVEELVVTDSVRSKAKEFVKKYMAKFGKVYKRPAEEAD